jgi:hypothetical protein
MSTVTIKMASFHKGDLHLFRGENEVPAHIAVTLMGDERFNVKFHPGEDVNAALSGEAPAAEFDDSGVPVDKVVRYGMIAGAILYVSLNDELFPNAITKNGAVDCRVLTKLLGWQVTTVDRDEAMKRAEKGTIDLIDYIPTKETTLEPIEDERGDEGGEQGTLDTGTQPIPLQSAPKAKTKPDPKAKTKGAISIASKPNDGTSNAVKV